MDAIVTAGGLTRQGEPLYEILQDGYKSLIPIAGKPMVQWVLDALGTSARIARVALVGLPNDAPVTCSRSLLRLPDCGDFIANLRAGAAALSGEPGEQVFYVSGDLPGITPEMIASVMGGAAGGEMDLYYTVIERGVMERRYPGSRRTYLRLRDGEFCGGDAHVLRKSLLLDEHPLSRKLVESRKNPLKQAMIVGLDTLALLLAGRLTVAQAEQRVGRRLQFRGKVAPTPFAELGMDVDKPFQLEMVRADLERQARA